MLRYALALATFAALPAHAQKSNGWELHPAQGDRTLALTYAAGQPVSYRFECGAQDVIITETGVTQLMDLQTGKPIADDAAGPLPPGAAMMALFGGKGEPAFQPAESVKNPAGGWDLTIRMPKGDKRLTTMGKSEMMSLFTTGFTMAVVMEAGDRAIWSDFLTKCRAS